MESTCSSLSVMNVVPFSMTASMGIPRKAWSTTSRRWSGGNGSRRLKASGITALSTGTLWETGNWWLMGAHAARGLVRPGGTGRLLPRPPKENLGRGGTTVSNMSQREYWASLSRSFNKKFIEDARRKYCSRPKDDEYKQ